MYFVLAMQMVVIGQVPAGPPVWQMNLSTIIMPCNYTGPTDPASTKGWGVIDLHVFRLFVKLHSLFAGVGADAAPTRHSMHAPMMSLLWY
jgi:hypothetical protein